MTERDGKQQMAEVRRLLMEWDLLGVADVPQCADEYDCMIGPLLGRLHRGADAEALQDWLTREVAHHFGLVPDPVADRTLADALVSWGHHRKEMS